jgi:glycosyltransferase involved in cell wall biosynthesis
MISPGKYTPLLHEAGVEAHCLNMPQGRITFSGLWSLFKLVRKLKPEIVQTWMYHADLVGGLIARMCVFFSYIIPKNIVFCAQKAYKVHSELGYSKKKLKIVYNGYDIETFDVNSESRSLINKEFNLKQNIDLLAMVSRFHPFKDHENLIKALSFVNKVLAQ